MKRYNVLNSLLLPMFVYVLQQNEPEIKIGDIFTGLDRVYVVTEIKGNYVTID